MKGEAGRGCEEWRTGTGRVMEGGCPHGELGRERVSEVGSLKGASIGKPARRPHGCGRWARGSLPTLECEPSTASPHPRSLLQQ